MEVWKYEGWRYVGIDKEVRALDTRVHENIQFFSLRLACFLFLPETLMESR